jgi:hypothetical protein
MREWVLENCAVLRSEVPTTELASSASPLPRKIQELMESFATAGLGLELKGRIKDLSSLPHHLNLDAAVFAPCAAAWYTQRGVATLSVTYDEAKSMRVKAHVLKIAWWIGDEHHDGWWHCYPKFPRDWIKGFGRP